MKYHLPLEYINDNLYYYKDIYSNILVVISYSSYSLNWLVNPKLNLVSMGTVSMGTMVSSYGNIIEYYDSFKNAINCANGYLKKYEYSLLPNKLNHLV